MPLCLKNVGQKSIITTQKTAENNFIVATVERREWRNMRPCYMFCLNLLRMLRNYTKAKGLTLEIKPKNAAMEFAAVHTKVQLNNFIASLKKKKVKGQVFELGDLEQILEELHHIPESDNEAFVVDYELSEESEADGHAVFRFFIYSKKLLRMTLEHGKHLHSDTTYKLVWEGFPVLIVGTTDKDRYFHMSGISVTSNEKTKDFEFLSFCSKP